MKIIFRNFLTTLRRFKLSSGLNILGLSIAFAAFMVIIMQVRYDLSFDKSYPDSDRIYRVISMENDTEGWMLVSRGAYDVYSVQSPGVELATLLSPPWASSLIKVEVNGTKVGFSEGIWMAFPTVADIFGLQFIDGANTLDSPDKIIMPESIAVRFFGTPYAAGKSLTIGSGSDELTVGGVYKDLPTNSQLSNVIYKQFPQDAHKGFWNASNYMMYVKLKSNYTADQVRADFKKFDQKAAFDNLTHFGIQKLEDVHYDKTIYQGDDMFVKRGDRATADIMLAIAILIVVIAGINFVNFSTSLAPLRMKNINTQKVFGCTVGMLRLSLICEAVGIAVISFLLGLAWVYGLSEGSLRDVIVAGVSIPANVDIVILSGVMALAVGLLSGIYPALYSTKFPPALVLKGSFAMSPKGRALRTSLICFQFVISIALIIGAFFMQIQNRYMRDADTGMDRQQIAIIKLDGELMRQRETLTQKLTQNPSIEDVAYSQFKIGGDNMSQGWGRKINGEEHFFSALHVSWNFPQVMGINLIEGKWFEENDDNKTVNSNFIFNKTAADEFGLEVPMKIQEWDTVYSEIIGIVEDFNFKSLHQPIEPTAMVVEGKSGWGSTLPFGYVKIMGDVGSAVEHITRSVAEIDPSYPVSIEFYDEVFDNLYKSDIKTTQLISLASLLAIIIALVGVFGLVVFETQYRRKEIGVRKVYGSSVGQILVMFSSKFIWIVGGCFVVAAPITYWGVDEWLAGFAYRTPMHWWIFALGGLIVLAITVVTVTVQSYRAAVENPIKSIKSE